MQAPICGRVGCGETAVAVLLMSPQDTQAWLVGLDHEAAPDGVPLCSVHADRISVPFGWMLDDDRPAPKKRRRKKKAAAPKTDVVTPEPESEPEPASSVEVNDPPEAEAEAEAAEPDPADAPVEDDAGYIAPEDQYREDSLDTEKSPDPASEIETTDHPSAPQSPSEVPLDADNVAAEVDPDSPRLSVVPGDDDPTKTYDFSDEGQGALWNDPEAAPTDPDESTPLLQRAFRVVRDD